MKPSIAVLLACLLCTGWTGCGGLIAIKPEPYDVHENTACRQTCGTCDEKNPVQITANPDSAIDAAKTERLLRDLCAERLKACEVNRQACVEALDRAKAAGAVQ